MTKYLLKQLEKQLEYCIREELYEKARDLQSKIDQCKARSVDVSTVVASTSIKVKPNKRFVDFLNENEKEPKS